MKQKKFQHMKKIIFFLLVAFALTSCYKDYINDFDYNAVYLPLQTDVRTFVVGEGMKFDFGVEIGGVRENTRDRVVTYEIDNSLITPAILAKIKGGPSYMSGPSSTVTNLLALPSNYYTLTNSTEMVIKKGQHQGKITVRPDSATFLADAATLVPTYAIGIKINTADADSIIEPKRTEVIAVKYENMLFGNYWHGGQAVINRPGKADTTINYFTTIPVSEAKIWNLKTAGPNSLFAPGYYDQVTGKSEMKLTLTVGTIAISSVAGSTFAISPEGASSFNQAKLLQNRKIVLKYTYLNTVTNYTYHCTDTLTFRNRMRDGVNEWMDENPSNY
jgi:hypothetical protein